MQFPAAQVNQVVPASPPGTFQALLDVADNLVARASECANTLHIQVDRVLGGLPPGPNEAQAPKPVPNGFIEQMSERFHSLDASLAYLTRQIERFCER